MRFFQPVGKAAMHAPIVVGYGGYRSRYWVHPPTFSSARACSMLRIELAQ
jgi:hypothetical protein